MERSLLEKLTNYAQSDSYPLHMPGHKRRIKPFSDPYEIDLTEIDGFDNLHHPEGILKEAQQRAAALYGSEGTYFLINGSTGGILATLSAAAHRGDTVLIARNSHKSAYHAAMVNGYRVSWLYPRTDSRRGIAGSITPEQVREAMSEDVRAVLITSPTYDGVVSDIRSIAEIVHQAGAVLIVDEAHGAHFAMHSYFPESAVKNGADLVVNSLHKTLPSLTQTALLHVNGPRVDRTRLKKYLDIYQSSSPSYVLMTSIDSCIHLMETQGEEMFEAFTDRLQAFRERMRGLQMLHLITGEEPEIHAWDFDRSKVLISTEDCDLTGTELGKILRERYHLEPEMEAERYVTAIMTAADDEDGFERLGNALLEIDAALTDQAYAGKICAAASDRSAADTEDFIPFCPEVRMTMGEANDAPAEEVSLRESAGRISAEIVCLYPPGIPLVAPGEVIPEEFPMQLQRYREMGLQVLGMADDEKETLFCVAEE